MHSSLTLPFYAIPNDIMDHRDPGDRFNPVEAPTRIDVVNGRGQGVHRHPGNETYRMLVSLNKVRTIHELIRMFRCRYSWS